jgi:Leucine-rich repeat (LRR) protein
MMLLLGLVACASSDAANLPCVAGGTGTRVTALADPNIPTVEWSALQDLYDGTDGTNWIWPDTTGARWNFSSAANNPCVDRWIGINCTTAPYNGYYFVTEIKLQHFGLTGTLSESIGSFSQLRRLEVRRNMIFGTLPDGVGSLAELVTLNVQGNDFSGSIPATIGQLTKLQWLSLERNSFNGTLPSELGGLTELLAIDVGTNRLSGTLPATLGQMSSLQHAIFFFNNFTGTLPPQLGNLTALQTFNVFNNSLHGPVPDSLCTVQNLSMLTMGVNHFSHTLPACLSTLRNLTYLDFFSNALTGSLPDSWAEMPALNILYLNKNQLSGTLDLLCSIPSLRQFYVELNYLTGSLPHCLTSLPLLSSVYLFGNDITGTIPHSYSSLTHLQFVDWSENDLSGTLPVGFSSLTKLNFLYLFGNVFSGTVPQQYSQLSDLSLLLLQNNFLTGPIDRLFNASHQRHLNTIQLSGNAFTGQLPGPELFAHAKYLTTFSAVDNCLEDSLSPAICLCEPLRLLALDGAGSARACHRTLLPGVSRSYMTQRGIMGTVPACLLHMSNLTTLHLSGNALTGTLPRGLNDSTLGGKLIDLAISHNSLTGTIPHALQRRVWHSLDLSYNRLSGALQPDFNTLPAHNYQHLSKRGYMFVDINYTSTNTYLSLENNRLSGDIPSTVYGLQDLSVLDGNLFSCSWLQDDLPPHDGAKESYQCGSAAFDAQLYAWLIVLAVSVLSVTLMHRYRASLAAYFKIEEAVEWCNNWTFALERPAVQARLKNFTFVVQVVDLIGRVAAWCTLLIVVVLVPVYAACSHYYGTITYQYAWTVSAAFLSGALPFALEFFFYNALIVFVLYLVQRYKTVYLHITEEDEEVRESQFRRSRAASSAGATNRQIYTAYVTFFAINFALVLGVNTLFVYVALYESSTALAFAQLFLSFFKGFWNSVGAMYLMRWSFNLAATNDTTRADFINTQLFVALFNNIAIPCLVVSAVSPDCFYNVFVPSPSISFTYLYLECAVFVRDQCIFFFPSVAHTSFSPPFNYSYQCGAQFITSYAPTFVYLAIEAAFLTPTAFIVLTALHKRATPGTLFHRALDYALGKALKPVDPQPAASGSAVDSQGRLLRDVYSPYFDANQLLVLVLTYLGILLTFGVVFPPLAVVLLVAIASIILTNRLIMGRYITNALQLGEAEMAAGASALKGVAPEEGQTSADNAHKDDKNSGSGKSEGPSKQSMAEQYLDVLEQDSRGVGCLHLDKLRISVWMLAWFCCLFYAIFFFDTLGNQQGAARAAWVFILFPLLPVGIYIAIALARRKKRRQLWRLMTGQKDPVADPHGGMGVELQELGTEKGTVADTDGECQEYGAAGAVNPLTAWVAPPERCA